MHSSAHDQKYMHQALQLALSVKGSTYPNPPVGAVVVKNGAIAGSGATSPCGGPHAEIHAIRKAGAKSRGAALYVMLEPCCHYGKTPPCTDAIIAAGIKEVFVAATDPFPLVSGKGIRALRKNGLSVHIGLLRKEAKAMNEEFFWTVKNGCCWLSLKLAMTYDGMIADRFGRSQWITSPAARRCTHMLRRRHAAIAVGRLTLHHDNPKLSVRHVRCCRQPARIVFGNNNNIDKNTYFWKNSGHIRSIIVSPGKKAGTIDYFQQGVEVWYTGDLPIPENIAFFREIAVREGLTSIMIEGGGKIGASLLEHNMVNKLYLYFGNHILGDGAPGIRFHQGLPLSSSITLDQQDIQRLGSDILISGYPKGRK